MLRRHDYSVNIRGGFRPHCLGECLTCSLVSKITPCRSGKSMGSFRWILDDPRSRVKPKANLPSQAIVVVHRSDGSGTTFIWTNYLSK